MTVCHLEHRPSGVLVKFQLWQHRNSKPGSRWHPNDVCSRMIHWPAKHCGYMQCRPRLQFSKSGFTRTTSFKWKEDANMKKPSIYLMYALLPTKVYLSGLWSEIRCCSCQWASSTFMSLYSSFSTQIGCIDHILFFKVFMAHFAGSSSMVGSVQLCQNAFCFLAKLK